MSLSILLSMGRIILPDKTDEFFEDRIKKWAKEFNPNLKFTEVNKPEILEHIYHLGIEHPIQAKFLHAYNLVMGNYYF